MKGPNLPWTSYVCFEIPPWWEREELSRSAARSVFRHFVEEREHRVQLTSLLATDGVIIDGSDRAIQSLNDWFRDQVQSLAEDVRMPDGLTLSITEDIAILLAETMIARASEP